MTDLWFLLSVVHSSHFTNILSHVIMFHRVQSTFQTNPLNNFHVIASHKWVLDR